MVRFTNCVKRREDVDAIEFRRYWQDLRFDDLQARLARALGACQYRRSLTLAVEANDLIRKERNLAEPFDGIIEYWWEQARDLMQRAETEEGRNARRAMLDYQQEFIALSECRAFFTEG